MKKIRQYSEISIENDEIVYFLSNALIHSIPLNKRDSRSLGKILKKYLNQKIIIDHFFWKSSLELCDFADFEIEEFQIQLKNKIKSPK